MTLSEHPWMVHTETGHRAQLPDTPYWRANGWEPCDGPPPEPDLTKDNEETPPSAGSLAVQPKKAAAKAVKSAPIEEGESVG